MPAGSDPAVPVVHVVASPPPGVRDRRLWMDAKTVLARHTRAPDGMCGFCRAAYPCAAVRFAERAEQAALAGGHVAHTVRVDAQSAGGMYGLTSLGPTAAWGSGSCR